MGTATRDVRNLCLVGHTGVGKTTLAEALLSGSGAIRRAGSVTAGTTVCDNTDQEHRYQHSLETAVCHFDYGGAHVNLLDTPGYPDLYGRAVSVLAAADTAVIVVNATTGVEMTTQRMNEAALEGHLCRLIVVNQCDVAGADLERVLRDIQATFGAQCLPMNLPAASGTGVVDCFFQPAGTTTRFSSVEEAHTRIIDQVVEVDDALMETYLEQGEELAPEQLHEPFETALRQGHLVPVCFTSAGTGSGIPELLEVIARLMPNPLEGNPPEFLKGEGPDAESVSVTAEADAHAIAHVFKVNVDQFRGRLGIFRVYQGTLHKGGQVYVGNARKPLKIVHLYRLQGSEQIEIEDAGPGEICAIPRAEAVHFDAVLHDSPDEAHFHLRSVALSPPMYGRAISTQTLDVQKVADALAMLVAEDPSLNVEHVPTLNETVVRCAGELHLRIVFERLAEQFGIEVETRLPSIAYRETVTAAAEGHYRHKKQSGGAGQFGEVFLRIEPLARGAGFKFINRVVGGAIPASFIPAVEKGVRQAMDDGAIAGFPMQDIQVEVHDGKHHPVDSKEIAFVVAGRKAFLDAVMKAEPILMEPLVNVSITGPDHCMGDITGDLAGMRGAVHGSEVGADGHVEIRGEVPLQEMQAYHSRLKSRTGGEGAFSMEFSRYDAVPGEFQKEMMRGFTRAD